MKSLRFSFTFLTIAIAFCAGNLESLTFPKTEAEFIGEQTSFPVTHEKIIVPVDGFDGEDQPVFDAKPVHEALQESNFRGKLKFLEPLKDPESDKFIENAEHAELSSQTRHRRVVPNNYPPQQLYHYQNQHYPGTDSRSVNERQPLHIDTSHYKLTSPPKFPTKNPKHPPKGKYSAKLCQLDNDNHYNGKLKKHQHHVQGGHHHHNSKLQLHKLPVNVEDVPSTDWFDNTGRYTKHTRHGDVILEPAEYAISRKSEKVPSHAPHNSYKSSYREPHRIPQSQVSYKNGDGLGNFLYKSEVYFPPDNSYNHHHSAPQVDHIQPVRTYNSLNHPSQHEFRPVTQPPPYALKHHIPSPIQPTLATLLPNGRNVPRKNSKGPFLGSPKSEPQRVEDEYDDESGENDDDSDNDRYHGPAPGDDDDEGGDSREVNDEDESSSENTRQHRNQDDDDDDNEEEEYQPKRYSHKWKTFEPDERADDDYNNDDENESFESSETRTVPQRIRFYHEKKEEFITPSKLQLLLNSENPSTSTEATSIEHEVPPPLAISPKLRRVKNVAMTMMLNNPPQQPTMKSRNDESSSSQSDDSDAGKAADSDLKYFQ